MAADSKSVGDAIRSVSEEIGSLKTSGLTNEQVLSLDNMFKVVAYIKSDVSVEYQAFRKAFGLDPDTAWEVVRLLSADEIMFETGVNEYYPYTQVRNTRAGYYSFDIPAEANATYKVEFEAANNAMMCIVRFWNETAVEKANRQEVLSGTYEDMSWMPSGASVQAPDTVKDGAVSRMTISFKTQPEVSVSSGSISNVAIYKLVETNE